MHAKSRQAGNKYSGQSFAFAFAFAFELVGELVQNAA